MQTCFLRLLAQSLMYALAIFFSTLIADTRQLMNLEQSFVTSRQRNSGPSSTAPVHVFSSCVFNAEPAVTSSRSKTGTNFITEAMWGLNDPNYIVLNQTHDADSLVQTTSDVSETVTVNMYKTCASLHGERC